MQHRHGHNSRHSSAARLGALVLSLATATAAYAQPLLIATAADSATVGNRLFYVPDAGAGLPTPTITEITSLPANTAVHGTALLDETRALVAVIGGSTVYAINPSTGALLDTIALTTSYSGGTIAIAPGGGYALVAGELPLGAGTPTLETIVDPFSGSPSTHVVSLTDDDMPPVANQIVPTYQAGAIVFDRAGRAFVSTRHEDFDFSDVANTPNDSFIHVLHAPYDGAQTDDFKFRLPTDPGIREVGGEGIALTPDESQLLAASSASLVWIIEVPSSKAALPPTITERTGFPMAGITGIAVPIPGDKAILVDLADTVHVMSAPFGTGSAIETLTLPSAVEGEQLEHVSVDPWGNLAVVTGSNEATPLPLLFIEAPFTTAGATSHAVSVTDGRGSASTAFQPLWISHPIFSDGFESGNTNSWQ